MRRVRPILLSLLMVMTALLATTATGGRAAEPVRHEFRDCPDCPTMVVVPAGRFIMGSPANEHGRFDAEGPPHAVSVHAFALGKYDVTSEEFLAFLRDAAAGGDGPYRLPSEAEWEYAARAGTTTARWWGDAIGIGKANCNGCGSAWNGRELAPVDSFAPNPFGIYDMVGNVWQWTSDCWNESYVGAPSDGSAWQTGDCSKRVLRGGSWSNVPEFIRSAARSRADAAGRDANYSSYAGFHVARTLP